MVVRFVPVLGLLVACLASQHPWQLHGDVLAVGDGATTGVQAVLLTAVKVNGSTPVATSENASISATVPRESEVVSDATRQTARYIAKVVLLGSAYGFIFGMMGAGGSLVLKPLLYFGFAVQPFRHAVFNSFLVLIVLAGYGASLGQLKGKVVWRDVALLATCVSGFGCVVGALLASKVSDATQLHFFAFLILFVATYMLLPKRKEEVKKSAEAQPLGDVETTAAHLLAHLEVEAPQPLVVTAPVSQFTPQTIGIGLIIGMLSGFAGVGGGFMLVPLLTHMGHGMDTAVPTSQAVICLSSTAGFFWYAHFNSFGMAQLRLSLTLSLMAVAMCGLFFSDYISRLLAQPTRQRLFAFLLIGIFAVITNPMVWGSVGTT